MSGVVEAVGPGVTGLQVGAEVFGATNPRFTGAYAQYALAEAEMIAPKPASLSFIEAASAPVVACTAHQMLFEDAELSTGGTVVVLGGGGNVGAYAVQLALLGGAHVVATGRPHDLDRIRALGAHQVVSGDQPAPPDLRGKADLVVDTVGGPALAQAFDWLRPGGALLSAVAQPDAAEAAKHGVRAQFILVAVTTDKLRRLASLFDGGGLKPNVCRTFALSDAGLAHRALEEKSGPPGKIVLLPG